MVQKKKFSIVLFAPDIPGNTGSIGRTCIALELRLILIKPYGFELNEKAVRRAGLDYWQHVNLTEYDSFSAFLAGENPQISDLFFFSKSAEKSYFQADFKENALLIFGSETKGLPESLSQHYSENLYKIPMFNQKVRSLNLSNAATAVAYECLRKLNHTITV